MSGQLKPLPIVSSSSSDISEAEEDPPQRPRPLQFFYTTKMNSISNGNGNAKGISNDDDRSDTESPVGPVKNKARPNDLAEAAGQNPPAGGGGHSYVNYPPDEEPPPVSRNLEPDQPRRERARYNLQNDKDGTLGMESICFQILREFRARSPGCKEEPEQGEADRRISGK